MAAFLRSSTLRFLLLVFALQIVSAGVILLFVQSAAIAETNRESRTLVSELNADLIAAYRQGGEPALKALIDARMSTDGFNDAVLLLVGADGRVRAGNLAAWPPSVPIQRNWQTLELFRVGSEAPERMGVSTRRLPNGATLLTGHVIDGDVRLARVIEEAMLGALLLALALALTAAVVAARVLNLRIGRVVQTARLVDAADLSRRVPRDGSGDAFDSLGAAFNAMLDRIETLVAELRIVTDGLAHDLRSPLTRLKAVLDAAAAKVTDDRALEALEQVALEADILLAMLATALQISRAEAGIGRDRFAPTDLGTLLADLVEVYGPLAEDAGFLLSSSADPGLVLAVHRQLIGQAVANLIDNAFKYGADAIVIAAHRIGDQVRISVADRGPGIAADRRIEALSRFGRLDPARHVGGVGLGLALVAAVAKLHGGSLALEDHAPGLRAVITLPAG